MSRLIAFPTITESKQAGQIWVNPDMVAGLYTSVRPTYPYVEVCKICLYQHTLETTMPIAEVQKLLAA